MAKAMHAEQVQKLTDIPNIGVSIAQDLIGLGITEQRKALLKKLNRR